MGSKIWEKMNPLQEAVYIDELEKLLPEQELHANRWYEIHTALPEICWQALVNVLEVEI